MRRKWKTFGGGILLSAVLLAASDLGATISWAAQTPPDIAESQELIPTTQEGESTADNKQTSDASSGDAEQGKADQNTENKEPQILTVSGNMIQPRLATVWSADIGNTAELTNAGLKKWWKDGLAPVKLSEAWIPSANVPQDGKFQLAVVTEDGVPAVYCKSQDGNARYDMMNSKLTGIDYTKNYILSAYVKTKDVEGTGFYMRAQIGSSVNKNPGDGYKLKGTSDGWVRYECPLEDLQTLAGSDTSGKMKVEIFFEKMTGEVWVKDIKLESDYSFTLDQDVVRMNLGETVTLQAQANTPDVSLGDAVWTSSREDVATVTDKGNGQGEVKALKGGYTDITATMPDGHSAKSRILVNDPAMAEVYKTMRDKWTERLTGNSYWNGGNASDEYKAIVMGYDSAADIALEKFVQQDGQPLFSDLDLALKEGSTSTSSSDSADLSTAISRVQDMAKAYASEGSKHYQNEELKAKILYAFDWVHTNIYNENLDNKARYGNWYHWWISMPQNLAGAAILMFDELNTPDNIALLESISATLAHFNENPGYVYKVKGAAGRMDMTGANLADTCLVSVLRSAVSQDQEGVIYALNYFDDMMRKVTSGEGIYEDGSFIQHTNLAYTGGYGATLLNGAEKIVYLTTGSDWGISQEQLNVVFNWIWDGIRPVYADGAVFDMVSGRSVARSNRSDYSTGRGIMQGVVLMAQSAPGEMKEKIQSFAKKHILAGVEAIGRDEYYGKMNAAAMMASMSIANDADIVPDDGIPYARIFGGMDKAVAHNELFSAGISFASKRTGRFEYGNKENSQGWHQSDGMLYMYNGDTKQYSDNFWNTVDSQRLPGITTDHSTWTLKDWGNYPGNANYNGGAALDQYAAVAMNFKNYDTATNKNLTAKKAWFVFDDEIVCLGAGISGIAKDADGNPVDTETIVENKKVEGSNQLLLNGTAYSAANKESMEQDVSWAWLEGNTDKDAMGYYFPEGNEVFVKRETRTGSWRDVNDGNTVVDGTQVQRNYVSLALKHGEFVNGKTSSFKYENYDYVLLPGKKADEVKSYSENPDIEILANNAYVQAAYDRKADVSGYIFWQPASSKSQRVGDVESDYATVVMKKDAANHTITLGISDPLQTSEKVKVRLYGNNLELVSSDSNVTASVDKYGAVIEVATKDTKGATFHVVFGYEDQSEEIMAQYQAMRKNHADNLTGNSFEDRQDPEYLNIMNTYTQNAQGVWDTLIKTENRDRLWDDLDVTLDYAGKGTNNNDSVPFDTTTDRIRTMALAYASEGSGLYHNAALGADIKGALEFVLDNYPGEIADKVYGNWWHWCIGIPQDLCDITLLMYEDLDQSVIDRAYKYLDKIVPFASHSWRRGNRPFMTADTAANMMDLGVTRALTGAIGNDGKGLFMASDALPSLMKYVTSGDGFYADGSFAQHGTMAYTGGYGADAIRGVAKVASLTNGTPWASTEGDPNVVYEWILNAFRPLYADGGVFEMVTGRQISRYNRNDITTGRYIMDAILTLAKSAPEQYKSTILSFAKTQVAAGVAFDRDAYYGRLRFSSLIEAKKLLADDSIPMDKELYTKIYGQMDKAVTHGNNFALGISMYSSRKGNAECGNNENYKGWYTSDGMTYLYNGDQTQYNDNYWPTVDMTRLAGITTNHVTGNLGNFSGHLSPNDWVGGSSVNNYHASVGMDFTAQFSDLDARKSWFVFGDQIVALGAGISTTQGDFTETIVENRKIDNDNTVLADGAQVVAQAGDKLSQTADWAWLSANREGGSIGYYFPGGEKVTFERQDNTGKWQDINTSANLTNDETAQDITRRYVTLAIEHGTAPTDADYGYVLLPGKTREEMADYAERNGVEILSNTKALQAARDTVTGVAGFNFWDAGSFVPETGSDAYGVTARNPLSMTIAEEKGKTTIGISDPTQKAGSVEATIAMNTENLVVTDKDDNVNVTVGENKVTLTVNTETAYGATFSAVLANEKTAEALSLLDAVQKFVEGTLSTADSARAEELSGKLAALDTSVLDEEDKARAEELADKLAGIISDMQAADKAVSDLGKITEVNKDNAEQTKGCLNAYDSLTAGQKALLTEEQKQLAENVRAMLLAYENNKPGGDDNKPGEDDKIAEGDKAAGTVEKILNELRQSLDSIKNSADPAGEVEKLTAQIVDGADWKKVVEDIRISAKGSEKGKKAIALLAEFETIVGEIFNTSTVISYGGNVPEGFVVLNTLLSVSYGKNALVRVEDAKLGSTTTLANGVKLQNVQAYSLRLTEDTVDGQNRQLRVPAAIRIPLKEGVNIADGSWVIYHIFGEGGSDIEMLPITGFGEKYVDTVTSSFSTFVLAQKDEGQNGGNGGQNDGNGSNDTAKPETGSAGKKSPKTYDDSLFVQKEADGAENAPVNAAMAAPAASDSAAVWAVTALLAAMLLAAAGAGFYLRRKGHKN